jgi:RNA polymerase sigma-70 factor (ECF subfamily)
MTSDFNLPSQPPAGADEPHTGSTKGSGHDDGLAAFLGLRARLFGIACRMLGNAAEAEEIVQDAWLRWQLTDRTTVRDATAFLVTTTTRLTLNVMQSARHRRETCLTPALREPADPAACAGLDAERNEALELAVRRLLETLSAKERAAYILREAFGCEYREIASLLRLQEANTRQVVSRARRRMASAPHGPASPSFEQRRVVRAFVGFVQRGDLAGFKALVAADAVAAADLAVAA